MRARDAGVPPKKESVRARVGTPGAENTGAVMRRWNDGSQAKTLLPGGGRDARAT